MIAFLLWLLCCLQDIIVYMTVYISKNAIYILILIHQLLHCIKEFLISYLIITSSGVVTSVLANCCANCVYTSRPQQCGPFWMAGTAPHKSERCRQKSRSDQPHANKSGFAISVTDKYTVGIRYQ